MVLNSGKWSWFVTKLWAKRRDEVKFKHTPYRVTVPGSRAVLDGIGRMDNQTLYAFTCKQVGHDWRAVCRYNREPAGWKSIGSRCVRCGKMAWHNIVLFSCVPDPNDYT